jgi:hypothetical protein
MGALGPARVFARVFPIQRWISSYPKARDRWFLGSTCHVNGTPTGLCMVFVCDFALPSHL